MHRIERIANELANEAAITRRMLERIPTDRLDWRPHPKSMDIRSLAGHIAELPGWVSMTLQTDGLDFAATPYTPTPIESTSDVLKVHDGFVAEAAEQLAAFDDPTLDGSWTLRNGETIYSTGSREDFIRVSLNQVVHHRAQLGVYLRLLDVPIPGTYGPSADENTFA